MKKSLPTADGAAGRAAGPLPRHASLCVQNGESSPAGVRVGVVENFRPGDRQSVDTVLGDLRALGIADLRTTVSWADWDTP
jgi:hypothetical protein